MNEYKAIGIQQWRLKKGYAPAGLGDSAVITHDRGSESPETLEESETVDASASDQLVQNEPQVLVESLEVAVEDVSEDVVVDDEQCMQAVGPFDRMDWQGLQALIDNSDHCPSCGMGNTLLGSGNANAQWMFVVDAPTSREVAEQSMCVGRAGELFDAMLRALGLNRTDVYVSSVFKCAPTADLSATPQCNEVLDRQIELVAPKVIITFGEFAGQSVVKANDSLESLRANSQRCVRSNVAVVPTYSPVQMLNDLNLKALVWEDLKKALAMVD